MRAPQPVKVTSLSYEAYGALDPDAQRWRGLVRAAAILFAIYGGLQLLSAAYGLYHAFQPRPGSRLATSLDGLHRVLMVGPYALLMLAATTTIVGGIGCAVFRRPFRIVLIVALAAYFVPTALRVAAAVLEWWRYSGSNSPYGGRTLWATDLLRWVPPLFLGSLSSLALPALGIILFTRDGVVHALNRALRPPPARRPEGVTVFAILGMLLGIGGAILRLGVGIYLFLIIVDLFSNTSGRYVYDTYTVEDRLRMRQDFSLLTAWQCASIVLMLVASGLLIAASAGLLSLRRWARRLLLLQARVALVINGVNVLLVIICWPMDLRTFAFGDNKLIEVLFILQTCAIAYDVAALIYFARPRTLAAFASVPDPIPQQ